MRQVKNQEEAAPLDEILTAALQQTFPVGTKVKNMTFNDKVGTMLLLKMIRHLAGDTLPISAQLYMALVYASLGASTEIWPTSNSTVDLLSSVN
jgi:hypothetical protein